MDWFKGKTTGNTQTFHRPIFGFRFRFSPKPIHWDQQHAYVYIYIYIYMYTQTHILYSDDRTMVRLCLRIGISGNKTTVHANDFSNAFLFIFYRTDQTNWSMTGNRHVSYHRARKPWPGAVDPGWCLRPHHPAGGEAQRSGHWTTGKPKFLKLIYWDPRNIDRCFFYYRI